MLPRRQVDQYADICSAHSQPFLHGEPSFAEQEGQPIDRPLDPQFAVLRPAGNAYSSAQNTPYEENPEFNRLVLAPNVPANGRVGSADQPVSDVVEGDTVPLESHRQLAIILTGDSNQVTKQSIRRDPVDDRHRSR